MVISASWICHTIPDLDVMISPSFFQKSLIWRHCIFPNSFAESNNLPPKFNVQLQHLQLLSLNSDIPEIAQFLPCLVVPRSCNLRFFSGNDPIDEEFRTIFSWISNQLRIPASDAHDQGQYIRSCDVLSHDRLQTADPILEFVVRESNYDSTFDLDTFLSLFPLGGVTFLDVFVALGLQLSPKFWATMFGSIQTLTTVYLAAETSSFWKALAPLP